MKIQFNKEALNKNKFNDGYRDFKTGEVKFKIQNTENRFSEKIGNYIVVRMTIENDINQSANMSANISFKDEHLWRTEAFFKSIGEDNIFNSDNSEIDLNKIKFEGREGSALVGRDNNGFLGIKKWMPKKYKEQSNLNKPKIDEKNDKESLDDEIPF